MEMWYRNVSEREFLALDALCNKDSRIKYVRYLTSGCFGKDSDYAAGNPTFFCMPKSHEDHAHLDDNFLWSVPLDVICEKATMQ